jgi:hypothetical protein
LSGRSIVLELAMEEKVLLIDLLVTMTTVMKEIPNSLQTIMKAIAVITITLLVLYVLILQWSASCQKNFFICDC